MLKKIFSLVFVLSLAVAPLASHAGFFDIFRTSRNYQNTAQLKSLTTNIVGLKRGDKSEVVLQVQQALTEAKLYAGDLSGLIGIKTEAAIKAWQGSHGLPVTGILDKETISSILSRGGENNNRGGNGGGNRDGGFLGQYAENPSSLEYLDGRCNNNIPAFVRILSPWQGDEFEYQQDDVNIQVFVCDSTGTGNTHSLGIVSEGIDIVNNSAIEGTLQLVGVYGDAQMTPYGNHSWIMNIPLGDEHFTPGHYSLITSDEGSYRINDIPQFGTNVYAGWTRPFEVTGEVDPTPSPLVFTLLETNDEAAVYSDLLGNDIGIFHFIFKIKNVSNNIVYMEKSCGSNESGVSAELINDQNQEVNPPGLMCMLNWVGTINAMTNKIIINPGEESIATVVFAVDPAVTPANYKAIVDTVNYQTPLIDSPNMQASIFPVMTTNYRTISN